MTRAALYLRISDDRKGEAAGVKRQEKDCRALCAERGWEVALVLTDNDISASTGVSRPGYARLLQAIKANEVDAVVAWDIDRLVRRPIELEEFVTLCDGAGIDQLATVHGVVNLGTGDGLLVARIKGAVAAEEVRKLRERIRRKHLELAEQGKPSGGGTRKFGYELGREAVRPDEADAIREAVGRVLAGESVRSICVDWNERGLRTVTGARWTHSVLQRVLTAPSTAGLRNLRGTVARGTWPAIIGEDEHRRLQAILLDPERRRWKGNGARRYLLTGFAYCSLCEARLVARPRGDKRRCYVCATGPGFHGCGKIRVLAEPLEADVVARLFAAVDAAELAQGIEGQHVESEEAQLLAEVAEAEATLEQLARDHYADAIIGRSEYLAAREAVEGRAVLARRKLMRLAAATTVPVVDADFVSRWGDLALEQQRAAIDAWVERVTVGPAVRGRNFYDADRVEVRWRR